MGKLKNCTGSSKTKNKAFDMKNQKTLDAYFKKPIKDSASTSLLVPNLGKYTTKQNTFTSSHGINNSISLLKQEGSGLLSTPKTNKTMLTCLDTSSDIEIIECTPELLPKKAKKVGLNLDFTNTTFCKPFTEILDDSLEFIPVTPQCSSINKSKNKQKMIDTFDFKSKFNIKNTKLKLNLQSSRGLSQIRTRVQAAENSTTGVSSDEYKNQLFTDLSKNGKRVAENSTGISPDYKKSAGYSQNYVNSLISSSSECNINLSDKIENSIHSDSANITSSENEKSFSLLQRGIEVKSPESNVNMLNLFYLDNDVITKKADDNICTENLIVANEHQQLEATENLGSVTTITLDLPLIDKEASIISKDIISDDQHFDEMLSIDFDEFSPFKETKPKTPLADINANKETTYSSVARALFKENLGESSYACRDDYGRHIVLSLARDPFEREIKLQLRCSLKGSQKTCRLTGFWYESVIKEGDIVHILMPHIVGEELFVSNEKGIIVINPDFLLSGTSVVSGVFCQRKAVLNEQFKGYDSGNKAMLVGSIVHQLFQESVKMREISEELLDSIIQDNVYRPNILRELYAQNLSEEEICEEIKKYKSPIISWIKLYLNESSNASSQLPRDNWGGKIEAIDDIEENIWSPKYGIKGKIDLTVTSSYGMKKKVLPLELKTGKSSFSTEHKGQVTLYSMMCSDRREDPEAGLLLYLRDCSMREVPAGEKEKKGLIQLRNEIVSFLASTPDPASSENYSLPALPEPLNNERTCSRCPHLLTCSAIQKVNNSVPVASHAMVNLVPLAIGHLEEQHLEYFRKWCLLLHLEIASSSNSALIKSLWCVNIDEREVAGNCLGDMVLSSEADVHPQGYSHFIHKFIRDPSRKDKLPLPLIFQAGESIVVSSSKEIAISLGVVCSLDENVVIVSLDRDLKSYAKWKRKTFTIDRCEYRNTMSIFFTNLAHLMENSPRNQKLRSLIIDRKIPEFCEGVEIEVVSKIKSILKNLNKNQQRAVLRSLLAKDYSILKGFPGTGKTSTIVGLVRILHCLGKSVLITSYTHSAVDNILLKIKEFKNIPILRLGKMSRIHPDILEFSEEIMIQSLKSVNEIRNFYNNQKVVATTCLGMGHVLFTQNSFDYCIMDEASQVLQAASLGPLFFSERFILVGDALQLPPVVKSPTAKSLGMLQSLFEYLDSKDSSVSLILQYRMNEPIMNIANNLIYEGQLMCGTEELKIATLSLPMFQDPSKIEVPKWVLKCTSPKLADSVLFVDTLLEAPEVKDSNNQPINPNESRIIIEIVRWFNKFGVSLNNIGIITPYRAQVKLVKSKSLFMCDSSNILEVNTVDQYQGRDKDIIIYSCVRSGLGQSDIKKGEILQDIRRLNVAITRAKVKLIVIGNKTTLNFFEPFRKIFDIISDAQQYTIQQGKDDFDWNSI